MGGFSSISSVLSGASAVANIAGTAVKTYNGFNNVNQNYAAAQAGYTQQEREIAQKQADESAQIKLVADEAERKRLDALKRTMARQKADFGGQGLDAADGSGQAVLLGLFQESADEKNYRTKLDQLRQQSLEQDVGNARRRNLLQLQQSYNSAGSGYLQQSANLANSIGNFTSSLDDATA